MAETASGFAPLRNQSVAVRGGVAILVAAVTNALLVVVADAVGVAPNLESIAMTNVVGLSVIGAVGATAVYAALGRYADDPERAFLRAAAAVLVLSFAPDLGLLMSDPAATVAGVVLLMIMHVVVAVASIGSLVYAR